MVNYFTIPYSSFLNDRYVDISHCLSKVIYTKRSNTQYCVKLPALMKMGKLSFSFSLLKTRRNKQAKGDELSTNCQMRLTLYNVRY